MNNLMYISNQNLDVITYQIIGQVKIPMTVIFSMIFLHSTYRRMQYFSLIILTIGVMIVVQIPEVDRNKSQSSHQDNLLGYITGLIAALLSGFAGVYFEKILKTTTLSVWARNLQLSLISVPLAFMQTFTKDYFVVKEKGFFYEYNNIVWLIVALQTSSGLTVALSVKLADNVSKGYASATSIIVSGIASIILFQYHVDYFFACGTALVVMSIPMYAISSSSKILPEKIDYEGKECYIWCIGSPFSGIVLLFVVVYFSGELVDWILGFFHRELLQDFFWEKIEGEVEGHGFVVRYICIENSCRISFGGREIDMELAIGGGRVDNRYSFLFLFGSKKLKNFQKTTNLPQTQFQIFLLNH